MPSEYIPSAPPDDEPGQRRSKSQGPSGKRGIVSAKSTFWQFGHDDEEAEAGGGGGGRRAMGRQVTQFYSKNRPAMMYNKGPVGDPFLLEAKLRHRDAEPDLMQPQDIFGVREPIDTIYFQKVTEGRRLGGHYEYVVGQLASANAKQNPIKKSHDEGLSAMIQPRPNSTGVVNRRSTTPRRTKAAFTDRSCRLREGVGAREVFAVKEDGSTGQEFAAPPSEQGIDHAALRPAGALSHEVFYNVVPPCGKASHPAPPASNLKDVPDHLQSNQVGVAMTHVAEDEGHLGPPAGTWVDAPPADGELAFQMGMQRKAKAQWVSPGGGGVLPHRGASVDPNDPEAEEPFPAGCFNRDVHENPIRGRQDFQARAGDPPPRYGAGMAIAPQEGDPPPPTQITACRKGDGVFSNGHSEDAHNHTIHWNPQLYRYEHWKQDRRPRSLPPDHTGAAGVPANKVVRGIFQWVNQDPSEPQAAHVIRRYAASNRSASVKLVTDHDAMRESHARERSERLQRDSRFAQLCDLTVEHARAMKEKVMSISSRVHRGNSSNVANSMRWDA